MMKAVKESNFARGLSVSRRAFLAKAGVTIAAAGFLLFPAYGQIAAPALQAADILIANGTVITMDPARRVLEDGAVAIIGNRIVAVGTTAELRARFQPRQVIDASRKVVMPGLIDGHGHAGHAMLKSLGAENGQWGRGAERLYAHASTPDFWKADAYLAGLEKLKGGVTTSSNLFGGGSDVYRVNDPKYADAYLNTIQDIGVRWVLGIGPRRGPYPSAFTDWNGTTATESQVSFEKQMEVSETVIRKWDGAADGRIKMAVVFPVHGLPNDKLEGAALEAAIRETKAAREMSRRNKVLFLQDGHTRGSVQFANDHFGTLGPDAIFSHATGLTDEEIKLIVSTKTGISHNPSAAFSMSARNPTTELIDAGATVMLGSDGVGPDRSYDMFRHMFQVTRYHRFYFRSSQVLPAGKVLEMVTIDAAKALGMEKEIGSLEAGKKADIILIDWFKPRLMPMNMPVNRIVYYANGEDVDTVLVDGRVLMQGRKVLTVNEVDALTMAQRELDLAVSRSGMQNLTGVTDGFWGTTRAPKAPIAR